jgi:hypothetical protein
MRTHILQFRDRCKREGRETEFGARRGAAIGSPPTSNDDKSSATAVAQLVPAGKTFTSEADGRTTVTVSATGTIQSFTSPDNAANQSGHYIGPRDGYVLCLASDNRYFETFGGTGGQGFGPATRRRPRRVRFKSSAPPVTALLRRQHRTRQIQERNHGLPTHLTATTVGPVPTHDEKGICHDGHVRWADLEREAPRLASRARERLIDTGVLLVATVRRDGTPRLSPIEPLVLDGDLWLSMM